MKKKLIFVGVLLCILVLGGCAGTNVTHSNSGAVLETKEPDGRPEVIEGNNLTLSVDYGFDKYVKGGRYMRVLADITNNGENFSGNLQVMVPNQEQKQYLYQKEVSLAAGETKRLEMAVPVGFSVDKYRFALADEEERVVAEKSVKAYISRDSSFFMGVLTDDTQGLSYLSGSKIKKFYLNADSFPEEALGLDSLDIIVVNDFNTELLNEKQYEALKEFVMQGGTLVLGTGSTGSKTMAAFTDSFLKGTMGELTKRKTAFGLNEERLQEIKAQLLQEALDEQAKQQEGEKGRETEESAEITVDEAEDYDLAYQMLPEADFINQLQINEIEKEILDIYIEGAEPLVEEGGIVLLEGVSRGQGRILVSTMDLGLDVSFWDTIGKEICEQITSHISPSGAARITREEEGNNYSYLKHSVTNLIDETKVPSVGRYVLVVLIYVVLIGPPLYFLLKKLDKRNLTWVVIPVLSVLFGSFIYGIGGTTRQDKPYINFMTINREGPDISNEETFFSITVPYNDSYQFSFTGNQNIVPEVVSNYYYGDMDSGESDEFNIAVKYGGDTTEVKLQNYSAFESVYFESFSSKTPAGGVSGTLNLKDFKAGGKITNNLGYDLKQAVLYAYGRVYPLGDIARGESILVDGRESYLIMDRGDVYSSYDEFLTKISGGRPYGRRREQTGKQVRWYYAYEYYFGQMNYLSSNGCYLIGFSEEEENEFLETAGLDIQGVNMIVAQMDMDLTVSGKEYIPQIYEYVQGTEGEYSFTEGVIYGENITMEVQFNKEDTIEELVYSSALNGEFDKRISDPGRGFYGEIKAYNCITGEYETIFVGGTENSVGAAAYLDENNKMRLFIEPDTSSRENYGAVSMPVISAVREVN